MTWNPLLLLVWALPVLVLAEARGVSGDPRASVQATVAVVFALAVACWAIPSERRLGRTSGLLLIVGLVGVAWSCPPPASQIALLAAAATGAAVLWGRAVPAALMGTAVLTAVLVNWMLPHFAARLDLDGPTNMAVRLLLELVGCSTELCERALLVSDASLGASEFVPVSATRAGLRVLTALNVGAVLAAALLVQPSRRVRSIVCFVLASAAGFACLTVVSVVAALEGAEPVATLDPDLRAVALGVPMLAALVFSSAPTETTAPLVDAHADPGRMVGVALGAAALSLAAAGPEPSSAVDAAVAFDEGHSFWERLDIQSDPYVYGARSEYNYSEWERELRARHGVVRRIGSTITDEALSGVGVLILKTPTRAYSGVEIDAIEHWVTEGGGLYLVGDHTDIFSMNSILNQVATRFGIEFRADATFEFGIEGGQTTGAGSQLPHPIADVMRPLHWMTSCTLALSGRARPVLMSSMLYCDEPDYGVLTFFGNHKVDAREPVGSFVQAASAECGRGRVFAFTDSTLLSNFSISFPGVRELASGGVAWLSRRPVVPRWCEALALLGGATLILSLVGRRWTSPSVTAALVAGFGVGMTGARIASRTALPEVDDVPRADQTVIDQTVSSGALPIWHESHQRGNEIWALAIAFQRQSARLRVALRDDEVLLGSQCILTWPKHPLPSGFVESVRSFVERGGSLFVFDSRNERGCATNDILRPFDLRVSAGRPRESVVVPDARSGLVTLELSRAATVTGGSSVLRSPSGEALVAVASYGAGKVVASGICEDFSSAGVGHSGAIDRDRKALLLGLAHSIVDAGRSARQGAIEDDR